MSVAETRPAAKGRISTPIALMPAVLQHEWDLYHATWFTLMGVGGGIFLLSRLMRLERGLGVWLGLPVVDLVSFAVIGVGGLILIWSLGRPSWRPTHPRAARRTAARCQASGLAG